MMERVLEPEVMDTEEEARDYDAMDHASVNGAFCDEFVAFAENLPATARVLDVGTGTALIPIALCERLPLVSVVGVDLAERMLALGRTHIQNAALHKRVQLTCVDAKKLDFDSGSFDASVSNSLVHHIPSPDAFFAETWRVTRSGGYLFVRDLLRPATPAELEGLVETYAGTLPEAASQRAAFLRQKELLRASLHAALSLSEVTDFVARVGIAERCVTRSSDRHWTLALRKP
jgi:ubiquinone/menaquinone biosynthesis C-methylase UbiE